MKKLIVVIVVFLSLNINAQDQGKDTTKYKRFITETGLFIPLGDLKDKIGVSSQTAFWYRTRIDHNDMMDFGINIIVPKVENSFAYQGKDSIYIVKAKGITIMLGCRMNKNYPVTIFNKKKNLEWSSTFGGSFFSFEDKENPKDESGYYTDENGNAVYRIDTNTKALSCIYLGQGIGLSSDRLGFHIDYNYMPYDVFSKRIKKGFGNSSLTMSLSLKL
ncbi:hypothetical protein [Flavobacterium sp.]|uniref:hypothetical protein n=1 Tax=Flavobacterium sp. TaxID=239 RepID=UPI0024872BB1|nr:hypothetical protein [Flavobacterium sp.]MDI1318230.1 hypothetical protein [Flavobacterium sp.]